MFTKKTTRYGMILGLLLLMAGTLCAGQTQSQVWGAQSSDDAIECTLSRQLKQIHRTEIQDNQAEFEGMTKQWKAPKPITNSGPLPKGGTDTLVDSTGDSWAPHLVYHAGTGNLFAVIHRTFDTSYQWAVYMSTDQGATWTETAEWYGSSYPLRDLSAAACGDYLYIAYVTEDSAGTYSTARIRRCSASTGDLDGAYFWVEVFDKGKEIREITLASNADYWDDRLYYMAILEDNRLVYHWDDAAGVNWREISTGITDAVSGLDVTYNDDPYNFLAVCYCNTSMQVAVALRDNWTVSYLGMGMISMPFSISAYEDNIIVTYYDAPIPTGSLKYKASYNGGASWSGGTIATSDPMNMVSYHDVTARLGGGMSVVYQSVHHGTGVATACWHTHCEYGSHNWTAAEPINEVDVVMNTGMSVAWLPSSGGSDEYGMLWVSDGTDKHTYFDRVDTEQGALTVDAYTLPLLTGGAVNFDLDAGSAHGLRNFIMLGSVTGTAPGTPLPGGHATLPINWDIYTDLMLPLLNSPLFMNFMGKLTSSGEGAAQLNAPSFTDTGLVDLRMNYAFCTMKPYDFASNPVEIRFLP